MKNKLLIALALFAAGIIAASCEKTPSGEQSADTQKQTGPATSDRQPGATPPQQATQEESKRPERSDAEERTQQPAGHSTSAANEQQNKEPSREQGEIQGQPSGAESDSSQRSAQAQEESKKSMEEVQQPEPGRVRPLVRARRKTSGALCHKSSRNRTSVNKPKFNRVCKTSRPVAERPAQQ
jgi:hypothetical protein